MNEISAENLAELEKRYRTTAFIVLGQIFVTLVLVVAAWFVAPSAESTLSSESLTTLWIAMLFIAIGTFLLRRLFFNWERLKNIALLKGVGGVLATLQRNAVILGALAEIVAIMGFLISTLSGNSSDMLRAGTIALVVFLVNFPRKGVWKKVVSNLAGI
jgi:hypothetical protein